jgi:Zn-finger protein
MSEHCGQRTTVCDGCGIPLYPSVDERVKNIRLQYGARLHLCAGCHTNSDQTIEAIKDQIDKAMTESHPFKESVP